MIKLEKILKKYNKINDFIIFGSAVKNKNLPKDIDVMLITDTKDLELLKKVKSGLKEKIHLDVMDNKSILYQPIIKGLFVEGYSIKKKKFLRDTHGIKPMKLYSYGLKSFNNVKKVQFSKALVKTIKKINAKKIGKGAVLVPINQSGYFEDFLDAWGLKYKTKELTVF